MVCAELKAGVSDSLAVAECRLVCEVHTVNVPPSVLLTDSSVTSGEEARCQCSAHGILPCHTVFPKNGKGHSVVT